MKFLLDESAELIFETWLTELGHDVTSIFHHHTLGVRDRDVLSIAHREGRILLTNDLDFGELVVRHREPHAGVILFRMPDATVEAKYAQLLVALEQHAEDLDQLIVVEDDDVRVREV